MCQLMLERNKEGVRTESSVSSMLTSTLVTPDSSMLRAEDNTDSAMDASAAAGPLPPAAATFAVALKLPDFWVHDPPSWFVHVEAQFALRGISADDTNLKELLLRRYALSDAERAEKLLTLSGLGGGTALELMESMLSLLGPDDGGFLFAHLFFRQLPAAVRAVLANSPLLAAKDYRSLAEEADRILLASRTFDIHALATDPLAALSTPPPASPGASAPLLTAGIATRRHRGKSICFYRQRFGARARRCLPPCAFTAQGNGPASAP
ncbi:protocadherin delta 2 [Sarotherodon galilaeus]